MRSTFKFSNGVYEEQPVAIGTVDAAIPAADIIEANENESQASIVARAYGANLPAKHQKLLRANGSLKGSLRAPRG